jgi:hypothetical protein
VVLPILLLLVVLAPNARSHEVVPVQEFLTYNQGDVAQFILYGDKNQTNISCRISPYYDPDPLGLDENLSLQGAEWIWDIAVNESGIGLFELRLVRENGFQYPGLYNVSFVFGLDLQNETGYEYYTAPRDYVILDVRLNEAYLMELFENAIGRSEKSVDDALVLSNENWNTMGWYTVILSLIFFWSLYVVHWHSKYDIPIRVVFLKKLIWFIRRMKHPLGHMYPLLNSDNFVELRRVGLRGIVKRKKWLREQRDRHMVKAEAFDRRLRLSEDDIDTMIEDVEQVDAKDPHLAFIKDDIEKDEEQYKAGLKAKSKVSSNPGSSRGAKKKTGKKMKEPKGGKHVS